MNDNVSLRPFTDSDLDRLVDISNSENISANLRDGFPYPYTKDSAEQFLKRVNSNDPITTFAITFKGLHVGNIGIHRLDDIYANTAELGYFIAEDYWGQGIATAAISKIIVYGFETLKLVRIEASVFEHNSASMKVLEKNGFQKEGIAKKVALKRGKILDEHKYAIIHPDYA